MNKKVVLFTGKARSGKDTSAQLLINHCSQEGVTTLHTYFAKLLKDTCGEVFGFSYEELYGDLKDKISTYQFSLQDLHDNMENSLQFGSMRSLVKLSNLSEQKVLMLLLSKTYSLLQSDLVTQDVYSFSPRKILQLWGTEIVRDTISNNIWVDCVVNEIKNSDADVVFITDARFDNEVTKLKECLQIPVIVVKIDNKNIPSVNSHISENGISSHLVDYTIENNSTLEQLEVKLKELFKKVRL